MKKITAFILGIALSSGIAFAQEPQDTTEDATDEATEYGEDVGERMDDATTQAEPDDATMDQTDPMAAEDEMTEGLSAMTAEELQGKTVVTASGEEVGEIDSIGESETHQARVATIDVGGFLGVAEKTIAIPLSELEMSSDGNILTSLTKEALEAEEEFDETGFIEEGSDETGY